jgi:hypothetical protein
MTSQPSRATCFPSSPRRLVSPHTNDHPAVHRGPSSPGCTSHLHASISGRPGTAFPVDQRWITSKDGRSAREGRCGFRRQPAAPSQVGEAVDLFIQPAPRAVATGVWGLPGAGGMSVAARPPSPPPSSRPTFCSPTGSPVPASLAPSSSRQFVARHCFYRGVI